jgi:hypothetical protein
MNEVTRSAPSVGDLLGLLAKETGTLVQQEVHLASIEMTRKARGAASDVGLIALGGALAHAGLLSMLFALVIALAGVIPMWVSSLAIGLASMGIGWAVVLHSLKSLRKVDPVPEQTVRTLQMDKAWMKEQVR